MLYPVKLQVLLKGGKDIFSCASGRVHYHNMGLLNICLCSAYNSWLESSVNEHLMNNGYGLYYQCNCEVVLNDVKLRVVLAGLCNAYRT